MPIIIKLDVLLADRKISSQELAKRIDLTPSNLSKLKTGNIKAIRLVTIERICQVLKCQPGDLLIFKDE
ncbi:MAG: helix-turn-helix transcriptional regulator [Candidatus Ozemobacteraceae bacterium]